MKKLTMNCLCATKIIKGEIVDQSIDGNTIYFEGTDETGHQDTWQVELNSNVTIEEIKPVKMTVAKLVKMAQAEMVKEGYTVSDLENNCLCELCQDTRKVIEEVSSELVSITSKEWSLMDSNESAYGIYESKEHAQYSILHDVVSYNLEGSKTTILQLKKKILANIIGE